MYERFTDRARKVMQLASKEAQRFNHQYLIPEHILLALVKEASEVPPKGASGVAAQALKNLNIELDEIRFEIEKHVEAGMIRSKLSPSSGAKKIVEEAIKEGKSLANHYVGTEHLLLALLKEQDGLVAQVLKKVALQFDDLRKEVLIIHKAD